MYNNTGKKQNEDLCIKLQIFCTASAASCNFTSTYHDPNIVRGRSKEDICGKDSCEVVDDVRSKLCLKGCIND